MIKKLIILFLGFAPLFLRGQNLITNGGFEQLSNCSNIPQPLDIVTGWYSPSLNTPDIFHNCFNDDCLVPITNCHGNQLTHSGDGYGGGGWYFNSREYLADKLTDTLKANQTYCLTFYINLANQPTNLIAIDRIGIYFSVDSVYYNTYFEFPVIPQLETPNGVFFNDTLGWTKVELQYMAQGGEQYIMFGNFRPDSLTHIQKLDSIAFQGYYYIDDVSLYECKGNAVDENPAAKAVNVYPNPASNTFNIQYNLNGNATFELYCIDGKKIDAINLQGQEGTYQYQNNNLKPGVYLYRISNPNGIITTGKLVIIK